jgi:hypothetical protein
VIETHHALRLASGASEAWARNFDLFETPADESGAPHDGNPTADYLK